MPESKQRSARLPVGNLQPGVKKRGGACPERPKTAVCPSWHPYNPMGTFGPALILFNDIPYG